MDISIEKRNIAIEFMKYCIKKFDCKDKSIYNILIFFLSEQKNVDELNEFLEKQEKLSAEV